LHFTETALHAIAKRALKKGTGARGLRSIIEDVMLDIMFELPDQQSGTRYVIDEEVVEGRTSLFKMPETKSA
jgi:ATP-dependent Clp protease ATP-binding subunit ClpX